MIGRAPRVELFGGCRFTKTEGGWTGEVLGIKTSVVYDPASQAYAVAWNPLRDPCISLETPTLDAATVLAKTMSDKSEDDAVWKLRTELMRLRSMIAPQHLPIGGES